MITPVILYIVGNDPRLTDYGGQQRVHFLWEALKKVGTVYTVYEVPHRSMEKRDDDERIYAVQLERRYSPTWFLKRLMLKWSNHITFPFYRTAKRIWKLNLPKPDVCVVRPASLAYSLGLLDKVPTIVDMDDIPSVEMEMLMKQGLSDLKTRLSFWWLKRMERRIAQKAKCIWLADEAEMPRFTNVPTAFVPNIPIPPLPDFANELGDENQLLFVGSLNSPPNYLALDWFLKKIWGEAKKRFPKLRLDIVGGGLSAQYKQSWSNFPDVSLAGRVDDLRPYYQKAVAVIAPMLIGSGSCLKVLEALRMGRSLLSTQQGLRGIRQESRNMSNGIFSFEDAESFLVAYDLLRKADRQQLQRGAVAFVEQRNNQTFIDKAVSVTLIDFIKSKNR